MADNEGKTRWHHLLGTMLEELLIPVGITVETDVSVMSEPPKADILLLRTEGKRWTKEQKERLPDGIRDVRASHVLLEFKYTESINKSAIRQTVSYDHFYRNPRNLNEKDVRTFLVSSKTPREKTLAQFGYEPAERPGLYRSRSILLEDIPLILLNELSPTPHNVLFKIFASRLKEKETAYYALRERRIHFTNQKLQQFMTGLLKYWFDMGGYDMKEKLTPEKVMKLGKKFEHLFWAGVTPEDMVKKFKPEDIAKALKPEDRLKGLSIQEIESYLKKLKKKSH